MKMGALIWLRCGGFLQLRCREGISTRTLTHPRHPHIPPPHLGQPKVNGPRDAQVIAWRQSCCATRVDRDGFFLRKDREKIIGKHHIPPTTKDMEGENLGEECRWRFWSGCYFWKVFFCWVVGNDFKIQKVSKFFLGMSLTSNIYIMFLSSLDSETQLILEHLTLNLPYELMVFVRDFNQLEDHFLRQTKFLSNETWHRSSTLNSMKKKNTNPLKSKYSRLRSTTNT